MPAKPWQGFGAPDPNENYAALVSYLPLKSLWRVFPFVMYPAQVIGQLKKAEGLIGYSLLAHPLSGQFWTLSAWKDEKALQRFVQDPPHVRIMKALRPHMAATKFVRWSVKGSDLPLQWNEALGRLADIGRAQA
jgi:quinol monooxygenase YgiN